VMVMISVRAARFGMHFMMSFENVGCGFVGLRCLAHSRPASGESEISLDDNLG